MITQDWCALVLRADCSRKSMYFSGSKSCLSCCMCYDVDISPWFLSSWIEEFSKETQFSWILFNAAKQNEANTPQRDWRAVSWQEAGWRTTAFSSGLRQLPFLFPATVLLKDGIHFSPFLSNPLQQNLGMKGGYVFAVYSMFKWPYSLVLYFLPF